LFLYRLGGGAFAPRVTFPAGASESLAVKDLNGDGALDFVIPDPGAGGVRVILAAP
jgi:hypothetical protein